MSVIKNPFNDSCKSISCSDFSSGPMIHIRTGLPGTVNWDWGPPQWFNKNAQAKFFDDATYFVQETAINKDIFYDKELITKIISFIRLNGIIVTESIDAYYILIRFKINNDYCYYELMFYKCLSECIKYVFMHRPSLVRNSEFIGKVKEIDKYLCNLISRFK